MRSGSYVGTFGLEELLYAYLDSLGRCLSLPSPSTALLRPQEDLDPQPLGRKSLGFRGLGFMCLGFLGGLELKSK